MTRPCLALAVVVLAAWTGACATSGAVPRPRPFPTPEPEAAAGAPPPATSTAGTPGAVDADAVVRSALGFRGVPYRNGGVDPKGFDCSGLVQYVFAAAGVSLPREVRDQWRAGQQVTPDRITPGDLVFFATAGAGASHVGIAIGGDQFVHAPSTTGVVRVERFSLPYWAQRYVGARRITN